MAFDKQKSHLRELIIRKTYGHDKLSVAEFSLPLPIEVPPILDKPQRRAFLNHQLNGVG
jgi:hypothetical protein